MYTAISIVIVIASILLTIIVLVQNSKGGGLAANFAKGNQTFGVRQTADFLEKATWVLAGSLLFLCIVGTAFIPKDTQVGGQSAIKDKIDNAFDPNQVPSFPAADTKAATPSTTTSAPAAASATKTATPSTTTPAPAATPAPAEKK